MPLTMKSLTDCYILNNGVKIPCIGFGTWQTPEGVKAEQAVLTALKVGYRHIDTASAYENQVSIGKALKQSGLKREEVFVTSKLFNQDHGYEKTLAAFKKTMKELQLDYLDLYLIHWPNPVAYRNNWAELNAESWRAFEEFYRAGQIRALGVSNFHAHHLEALAKTAEIPPAVNQIRLCPGDPKQEVVTYSREQNILIEAYSPFGGSGGGNLLNDQTVAGIAKKYGKSPAQVCLRWSLQNEYLPLPKSVTPDRIASNTQVFDFELDQGDVDLLTGLKGYPDPFPHPDHITW
ncbi:MAG: aldo/keto reductase [Treponema sp.]|nr:aldo/keto reductase [Treponema sp.]